MTRYDILTQLREVKSLVKNDDGSYNKIIQSGELSKNHYDYGVGFYDVSIYHIQRMENHGELKHYCRVWFGTIDDGDFGSWNELKSKEKAIELVEKVAIVFNDIDICPSQDELNKLFQNLGVYFCHE